MSNKPSEVKIKSVRQVSAGSTRRVDPSVAEQPLMTMRQAGAKWSHLQEEVSRLSWSQVPPQMLADFLLAASETIRCDFGPQAQAKAAEILAISLAERDALPASVICSCSGSSASIEIRVEATDDELSDVQPMHEFELATREGASEEDIREGLANLAAASGSDRLVLAPSRNLPSANQKALVEQFEKLMGDQAEENNQFDALMCASALLVIWDVMERRNAALADFTLSGLSAGGQSVAEGKQICLQATRGALDDVPDADVTTFTQEASVRFRPS